jgi:hypothetical protein
MTAKLFTDYELGDPFMAMIINTRFNAFLSAYARLKGLTYAEVCTDAREVLRAVEITQPGDEPGGEQ